MGTLLIIASVILISNEARLISATEDVCNEHYQKQFEKKKDLDPEFRLEWEGREPIPFKLQ